MPLNTGDVIWVKHKVTYKLKGAPGNPLDISYTPDWTERLDFEWKGVRYRYEGDAELMLMAISPHTHRPVLVAQAADKGWHWKHSYRCTTPFYEKWPHKSEQRDKWKLWA